MKRKISLLLLCMLTMAVSAQKNYKFEVDTLRWAGDKCINIVFLGDGYVESELGTFKMDAAKQMNSFLKQDPYKRYSKYFNFVCIPTPSNENGAGLTPDKPKDTMYKVCFGTSGVDRMPWPTDWTAVNKVLSTNFPSYDMVAIITDTTKYGGGGGGKFICYTKNESSIQTLYHESGHSFGSLADEYWYAGREAANMTRTKDPEKIKWKNWLGYQQVGIYPFYGTNEDSNYVRPHQNCLMRYLGKPFCAVCKEALVERVHNIVNPIREQDPKLRVPSINDSTITLKITTLKPTPNTLKTIWTFRGDTIARKVDSVKIITDDLTYSTPYTMGNDGRPVVSSKRYFPKNVVSFFGTANGMKLGSSLWGVPPEEGLGSYYDTAGTSAQSPYVYMTQWSEKDPAILWTKASALYIPVLYNPNSLYVAKVTETA